MAKPVDDLDAPQRAPTTPASSAQGAGIGLGLKLTGRVGEDADEVEFTLTAGPVGLSLLVGRGEDCDVLLEAATVSGRHGLLRRAASGWCYADLGSRNGSAWRGAGSATPRPLAVGQEVALTPGGTLLLGDSARPVALTVHALGEDLPGGDGVAAEVREAGGRTVVARHPLVDLLVQRPDALLGLAADALACEHAEDLAQAGARFLEAAAPGVAGYAVTVQGTGFYAEAGQTAPAGLVAEAARRPELVVLSEGTAEALPTTRSVAGAGIQAALVAPLRAGGVHHGQLLAWSPLGPAVFPPAAVDTVAVGASILALAAGALATRRGLAAERARLEREVAALRGTAESPAEPLGTAPSFRAALDLARAVAGAAVPVLLRGETGTGKEVLARAIHGWSPRARGPFVAFNCAAVPAHLIESELFGHVRGAFTGATGARRGLFAQASGGTLLLDEIGEMPLDMQAKLLRVLQEGEVRPVGADRAEPVDVRVLSATHRDLAEMVAEGRFRADLMYRINAITVTLPPLRERPGDVRLLAHHLLGRVAARAGRETPGLSAQALAALEAYPFPGNVRELENELLRAVALTPPGHPVRPEAFSPAVAREAVGGESAPGVEEPGAPPHPSGPGHAEPPQPVTLKAAVEAAERAAVRAALQRADGNVSRAARELGLTRPGLYKVMARLGVTR